MLSVIGRYARIVQVPFEIRGAHHHVRDAQRVEVLARSRGVWLVRERLEGVHADVHPGRRIDIKRAAVADHQDAPHRGTFVVEAAHQ